MNIWWLAEMAAPYVMSAVQATPGMGTPAAEPPLPVPQGVYIAKVVDISDGDALTVLGEKEARIKVRLASIDAPEKAQEYGPESTASLVSMCYNTNAYVQPVDRDQYGRLVSVVRCGEKVANIEQVKRGMAWVYRKFSTEKVLLDAEKEARTAERGLWQSHNPTPPWDWRKENTRHGKAQD